MVQPWSKPFRKTKGLEFEAEYEIELEAGVTEHKKTTAELASLLTRTFERMVEQFFDCFTDGLELKLDMFCSLAWPEMDMMWREGTLAFVRLLVYHMYKENFQCLAVA